MMMFPPISGEALALDLLKESPVQFAQQMSSLDNFLFSTLAMREFHNQNWIKHTELAPNLKEIIDRFNRVRCSAPHIPSPRMHAHAHGLR